MQRLVMHHIRVGRSLLLGVLTAIAMAPQMYGSTLTMLSIDAGGGITATVEVDNLNSITCTGTCGGLIYSTTGAHNRMIVIGTLGQFDFSFTGLGGSVSARPALENLNQLVAASTGPGTLTAAFTDTGYVDFADTFNVRISGVNDTQINTSTSDFLAYVSSPAPGSIPAINLFGSFIGLTGDSYNYTGTFANPAGATGSLTQETILAFSGVGTMQASFTISNAQVPVPEPESASLVFLGSVILGLSTAFRKKFMPKRCVSPRSCPH